MNSPSIRTVIKAAIMVGLLGSTAAYAANEPVVGGAPMYANKNIIENAVNSKDHTTLVAAVKAGWPRRNAVRQGTFHRLRPHQRSVCGVASRHGRNASEA